MKKKNYFARDHEDIEDIHKEIRRICDCTQLPKLFILLLAWIYLYILISTSMDILICIIGGKDLRFVSDKYLCTWNIILTITEIHTELQY
jgi:hypothetical protein